MRLAVLTTGRQDWGILRSTCRKLKDDPGFHLAILAGGMHLSILHGETIRAVEADGCVPAERLDWMTGAGSVFAQTGQAISLIGEALFRQKVDALLLAGDRFETAAGALAATLCRVPVVHLHGGEETEGAIDNSLRHAITKLSHLHLTSHADHAARVISMGEDPRTVHVVGAPGLDNLHRQDLADRAELETFLGLTLTPPVVVVTFHPTTLGGDPAGETAALVEAMDRVPATYVVTLPNADPGHEVVRDLLKKSVDRPGRRAVDALGERRFWGLLRLADAMLGNSSSALIEAPVLGVPVVNIGTRQKGRLRGDNVIDAEVTRFAIVDALKTALSPSFRQRLQPPRSPFGDGRAADRIVEILSRWTPPNPPIKAALVVTR